MWRISTRSVNVYYKYKSESERLLFLLGAVKITTEQRDV